MIRLLISGMAFFWSVSASAQQVYKCVQGKDVSYQSQPCAQSDQAVKAWDAVPEPPPSNEELWRRYYAKKRGQRESAYLRSLAGRSGSGSGASIRVPQSSTACAAAKASRTNALNAAGLKRTYELLQALDDAVNRACK